MRRMQPVALAGQQVVVDGAAQEVVREASSRRRPARSRPSATATRSASSIARRQPDDLAQQPVGHGVARRPRRARTTAARRPGARPACRRAGRPARAGARRPPAVRAGRPRGSARSTGCRRCAETPRRRSRRRRRHRRPAPGTRRPPPRRTARGRDAARSAAGRARSQPANPGRAAKPVGADGRHDQQALRGHPAEQEAEEVGRGRVDPLQVLDHDDDRATDAADTRRAGPPWRRRAWSRRTRRGCLPPTSPATSSAACGASPPSPGRGKGGQDRCPCECSLRPRGRRRRAPGCRAGRSAAPDR